MMRYSLEIRSKTLELTSYILFLILSVFFTKNEFFYRKSFKYNMMFQILEVLTLVVWILAFFFRIRHLFLKYIEILRRRDSPDDETQDVYGTFAQFSKSSQNNILTLDKDPSSDGSSGELMKVENSGISNTRSVESQGLGARMASPHMKNSNLSNGQGSNSGDLGGNGMMPPGLEQTPNYSIRSRKQYNRERMA